MSVTIRLEQVGKKNNPAYRIVASNTRSKRGGRQLETIGFYSPLNTPVLLEINKERVAYWQSQGAITSESVQSLIAGKYKFTKYNPKKAAAEAKANQDQTKEEAAKETTE